jgi:phosphohistidine phosphatase
MKETEAQMKTVLILRHARAKRDEKYVTDQERPLMKEGKEDAAQIGEKLRHAHLAPDIVLSSTAKRAAQTALRVYETFGYEGEIMFTPRLYSGGVGEHLAVLEDLPEEVETALIVGHNPTLEELVAYLTGETISLATAEAAIVQADVAGWHDLGEGAGRLKRVLSPGKK